VLGAARNLLSRLSGHRLSARMRRIKAGWFDWMGIDRLDREAYAAAVSSEFFGKFDGDVRAERAA
jgi:hypothetical protein